MRALQSASLLRGREGGRGRRCHSSLRLGEAPSFYSEPDLGLYFTNKPWAPIHLNFSGWNKFTSTIPAHSEGKLCVLRKCWFCKTALKRFSATPLPIPTEPSDRRPAAEMHSARLQQQQKRGPPPFANCLLLQEGRR